MQLLWFAGVIIVFVWLIAITVILGIVYRSFSKKRQNFLPATSTGFSSSIVKFNPFPDMGGDQSFVLALLNSQKTGILITSLHARGTTRFYAKRIVSGESNQPLSAEEKQALAQASTNYE
jgi:hypothetical protein